jgi:hypothetical protein
MIIHAFATALLFSQIQPTVQMVSLPDCNGAMYAVDVYRPLGNPPFPVVGLGHGFQNNKTNFKGLAQELAANGILVVVPQFPSLVLGCMPSDHARNGRIIGKAIESQITSGLANANQVALAGHSAGGLAAFSLASTLNVRALVLLDAVDSNSTGTTSAPMVSAPTLFLVANPSMCNTTNNSLGWFPLITGPKARLNVTNATHCDPQEPSSLVCSGGCGGYNMTRSLLFKKYASLFLRHYLFPNGQCFESLAQADLSSGVLTMPNFQLGICDLDAGVFDAGVIDAGVKDAGILDSGVTVFDGGNSPIDSGIADAGIEGDARVDSGIISDGGSTAPIPKTDAGIDMTNTMPQGCGCQFSPNASLAFLAVAFFIAKRNRFASRRH